MGSTRRCHGEGEGVRALGWLGRAGLCQRKEVGPVGFEAGRAGRG